MLSEAQAFWPTGVLALERPLADMDAEFESSEMLASDAYLFLVFKKTKKNPPETTFAGSKNLIN